LTSTSLKYSAVPWWTIEPSTNGIQKGETVVHEFRKEIFCQQANEIKPLSMNRIETLSQVPVHLASSVRLTRSRERSYCFAEQVSSFHGTTFFRDVITHLLASDTRVADIVHAPSSAIEKTCSTNYSASSTCSGTGSCSRSAWRNKGSNIRQFSQSTCLGGADTNTFSCLAGTGPLHGCKR
jgi:hypothetical protein